MVLISNVAAAVGRLCLHFAPKALALLENDYSLKVTRVNVLEGEDSEKKIKQMKTFSGANTVPQVLWAIEILVFCLAHQIFAPYFVEWGVRCTIPVSAIDGWVEGRWNRTTSTDVLRIASYVCTSYNVSLTWICRMSQTAFNVVGGRSCLRCLL